MKWICAVAAASAMAASALPARAAVIPDCPVPPGVVKADLRSGLPPALRRSMGNIALPGGPFDTTDVYVKGHKHGRYIFVWNIGKRWIVATEQGGIALRDVIFVYELGKDGKTAALIKERVAFSNSVCADATRLAGR
jgi:hypothetical protein